MFGPCIRNDTDRRIREIKFFVTDESFIARQLGFQWNGKTVSIRVLFLDVNISTGETKRDSRSTRNFPPLFNELIESFFALNLIISFVVLFLSSGKIIETELPPIENWNNFSLCTTLFHSGRVDGNVYIRLFRWMEEQTRSTFGKSNWLTRLCAPIVWQKLRSVAIRSGWGKLERFQKAWMGPPPPLIKGCLRGPNMRASKRNGARSRPVANDRPPRRVATRESRWPQSAAPFHYVFRYDISIVDGSEIKLLCSRACGGVRVAHKSTSTCNTWGNTWSYYEYWNRISAHYRVKYFNG